MEQESLEKIAPHKCKAHHISASGHAKHASNHVNIYTHMY